MAGMWELSFQAWALGNKLGLSYTWTPPALGPCWAQRGNGLGH